MSEEVGYVVGEVTPLEFTFAVNPKTPVPLYEYVYCELEDVPPGETKLHRVKVIAQVHEVYRVGVGLGKNVPYDVAKNLAASGVEVEEIHLAKARVLGYVWRGRLVTPRRPPRANTKVFRAPTELVKELYSVPEDRALHIGYLVARPEVPVYLDVEGLKRHLAIIAATGSGKTWCAVLLIEELLKKGATIVVIDPHGEYVKLKEKVHVLDPRLRDRVLVLKASRTQEGDKLYRIKLLQLDSETLSSIAGIPQNAHKIRHCVRAAFNIVKAIAKYVNRPELVNIGNLLKVLSFWRRERNVSKSRKSGNLSPEPIVRKMLQELFNLGNSDSELVRKLSKYIEDLYAATYRDVSPCLDAIRYLRSLKRYGVYTSTTTPLHEILQPAHVTILNLSGVKEEIQDHIVYNVLTRIFNARVRYVRDLPGERYEYPVVVFIEEAHRFAPPKHRSRRTWSQEIITRIASEGRKFGVYLVVITQRPSKIDSDVLSQCQNQIVLKIVNPKDQEAIKDASEVLSQDLLMNLPSLNTGEAIVVGPLTKAPVIVRLRDRILPYGGSDIVVSEVWSRALTSVLPDTSSEVHVLRKLGINVDQGTLRKVMPYLPYVTYEIDPLTLTILGKVSLGREAYVEYRLGEGTWYCSACRHSIQPCVHVLALLLKVIASKDIKLLEREVVQNNGNDSTPS